MSAKAFDGAWDNAEVSTAEHDELVLHLLNKQVAEDIVRSIVKNDSKNVHIRDVYSEVVVGKSFIHGYIDVMYTAFRMLNQKNLHSCWRDSKDCVSDKDGNKCTMVGTEYESTCKGPSKAFYFEVKPRVENFGSLLRQINKYKANVSEGFWIVYTKECPENIKTALEGQGVHVLIHKP